MVKLPPISSLDRFQQAYNEASQCEESVKDILKPVYDVLDSYHECQDAYDALAKAEERLVMAYLIMGWAAESGLILSFTD